MLTVGQTVDQDGPVVGHRSNGTHQRYLDVRRPPGCRNGCLAASGDRLEPSARGPAGWRTEDEPRVRRLENLLGQPLLWCERSAEAFEFAFSPLKLGVY